MRYVLVLVTLALASLSVACDTSTASSTGPEADEKRKVTASPVQNPRLTVGDTATTAGNGTTLAVLSYESPAGVKGATPEQGHEFAAVEVKGCAGPDSENSLMHISPGAFVLRMPDGTRLLPEGAEEGTKVKEPALQSMNPLPGECDRGFVTFQTPRDERPELLIYDEEFVLKNSIAWKVPEKG